jgi:hypothetical protein
MPEVPEEDYACRTFFRGEMDGIEDLFTSIDGGGLDM